MLLRFEKSGEKDIQMRIVFGTRRGRTFERGKSDFLMVLHKRVSVHPAIMDDTSIKEPWSTQ